MLSKNFITSSTSSKLSAVKGYSRGCYFCGVPISIITVANLLQVAIFLPAGARTAGTKIALRFPRLFVRPHLSRAQYNTSYVTMQLQCIVAFGGLQAKL